MSHRPRGCFVSEGVQRWMIILCSLQRLYGRVWLFFWPTPHLKILSNSPQEKHLLDRWLFSPAAGFTFFSLKQNSLPFTLLNFSRKEVVRYAQSRGLSLWCESKCNEEITLRNFKSLINNNYINPLDKDFLVIKPLISTIQSHQIKIQTLKIESRNDKKEWIWGCLQSRLLSILTNHVGVG